MYWNIIDYRYLKSHAKMKTRYSCILLITIFFIELFSSQISGASNLYVKDSLTFCRSRSSTTSFPVISEKEKAEINIFPNPASSTITVSCNKPFQSVYMLSIYDLLGKKVKGFVKMVNNKIEIDVSDLQNGIYFLQMDNKQEIIQQEKIVITR